MRDRDRKAIHRHQMCVSGVTNWCPQVLRQDFRGRERETKGEGRKATMSAEVATVEGTADVREQKSGELPPLAQRPQAFSALARLKKKGWLHACKDQHRLSKHKQKLETSTNLDNLWPRSPIQSQTVRQEIAQVRIVDALQMGSWGRSRL